MICSAVRIINVAPEAKPVRRRVAHGVRPFWVMFSGLQFADCHPWLAHASSWNSERVVNRGTEKDHQILAEENWASLAREKGFRCSLCGTPTAYDERELYFRTGKCGNCANAVSKDD